jgi:hypothetical protein
MKKYIKIGSIILVIAVAILFLSDRTLIYKIQGWHLEDEYTRTQLNDSKYTLPGMSLTEILSFNKTDSIAEVATYKDIASTYPSEFKEGDPITVSIETYSNPIDNAWFKGKIISIDKNYIPLNNYPSIKYKIQIFNREYSNNIPSNLGGHPGSMINSLQDGDSLVLNKSGVREINGKNYVCVVTQTLALPGPWDGTTYLIKFKLKEIQVGSKVYNYGAYSSQSGLVYSVDVLSGLSKNDVVVDGHFTTSSNPNDFNCGNSSN